MCHICVVMMNRAYSSLVFNNRMSGKNHGGCAGNRCVASHTLTHELVMLFAVCYPYSRRNHAYVEIHTLHTSSAHFTNTSGVPLHCVRIIGAEGQKASFLSSFHYFPFHTTPCPPVSLHRLEWGLHVWGGAGAPTHPPPPGVTQGRLQWWWWVGIHNCHTKLQCRLMAPHEACQLSDWLGWLGRGRGRACVSVWVRIHQGERVKSMPEPIKAIFSFLHTQTCITREQTCKSYMRLGNAHEHPALRRTKPPQILRNLPAGREWHGGLTVKGSSSFLYPPPLLSHFPFHPRFPFSPGAPVHSSAHAPTLRPSPSTPHLSLVPISLPSSSLRFRWIHLLFSFLKMYKVKKNTLNTKQLNA